MWLGDPRGRQGRPIARLGVGGEGGRCGRAVHCAILSVSFLQHEPVARPHLVDPRRALPWPPSPYTACLSQTHPRAARLVDHRSG